MRLGARGARLLAAMVLFTPTVADPSAAGAQQVVPGGRGPVVTTDLSPDHWAIDAVLRAEALGLLNAPLPFRAALSVDHVARALDEAVASARGQDALVPLTEGWRDRFYREFGGLLASGDAGARLIGLHARLEGVSGAGRAAPGFGEIGAGRSGATPVEDETWLGGEGEASMTLGSWSAIMARSAVNTEGVHLRRFGLAAGWGNWKASIGRQPVGLRKAPAAGLLLSGGVVLDRLSLRRERPTVLPGWLDVLGPVGAEIFVSRLWDDDRHDREPFLWGGTLSIQPFPRLGLAVHRTAMLGGVGYDEPLTLQSFIDMLIGRVANLGFENQLVSVEARYRLPTEGWLPLTGYLEWGAEDAAGGWWDVPGRVIGLESPAIPGLESLAVGAAYTAIADHCCGNSPWYRHWAFPGTWAAGDQPLGHPLGGEGWEWLAYGTFDRPQAGYRVEAQLFHRDRAGQNLFVPGRGRSDGVAFAASWRERPGLEATVHARVEAGPGWSERRMEVGANVFF